MTEAPRPILLLIGVVSLVMIGGAFYLGYYALTAPDAYDQPAVATAPAQPAAPATPAPTPAPTPPAQPPT